MKKRLIFITTLLLLFSMSRVRADEEFSEDVTSFVTVTEYDIPPVGETNTVEYGDGNRMDITDNGDGTVDVLILIPLDQMTDENGNPIDMSKSELLSGNDALKDGDGKNYNDNVKQYQNEGNQSAKDTNIIYIDGKPFAAFGHNIPESAFKQDSITKNTLEAIKANPEMTVAEALETAGIGKNNPTREKFAKLFEKALKDPSKIDQLIKELNMKRVNLAVRVKTPKVKIISLKPGDSPTVAGNDDKCKEVNQKGADASCLSGSCSGEAGACSSGPHKVYAGSYNTTRPNNDGPTTKDFRPCLKQRGDFINIDNMGPLMGHRNWSEDTLKKLVPKFNKDYKNPERTPYNQNPYMMSYQGEARRWNPFKEGNKLSGLPYKIEWSPTIDSWYDNDIRINPSLKESIAHKDKAEASNLKFAQRYGVNDKLKVYTTAPNRKIEINFLNLESLTWDKLTSSNIYCTDSYKLKIEPGRDILKWNKYRDYIKWTTTAPKVDCSCKCTKWEVRVSTDNNGNIISSRKVCVDDEIVKTKTSFNAQLPNGSSTTGPSLVGKIPPVYGERRKWKYRIGAAVEYHAITKPEGSKLKPIPNANKNENTIKSGYGFNYKSRFKVITDYDKRPSDYKFSSFMIRPNKDRELSLYNNRFLGSLGKFDANVRYDARANAPEKSSSVNKTYIQEQIGSKLASTTFNPNDISNVNKGGRTNKANYDNKGWEETNKKTKTPIDWNNRSSIIDTESANKYYHAYWVTKGNPNLVPTYKPGPLHFIHLDYPSETDYTMGTLESILFSDHFRTTSFNRGTIRVIGNMFEDSFSRPDFKKSINR